MPESIRRLCIQWPRFGPYHLARLRAVHAFLETKGVELIALETAGEDATYAWRVEAAAEPFRREQVFHRHRSIRWHPHRYTKASRRR